MKKLPKQTQRVFVFMIMLMMIIFWVILAIQGNYTKTIANGVIKNSKVVDGKSNIRGTIINVPIDSRPISRSNFANLVESAGYKYIEFSKGLDVNENEWETYIAGDTALLRKDIESEFSYVGDDYNKESTTMIINGSSYFLGGLVATSDYNAYGDMGIKIQNLKSLVSTYNNIEYYVIFNIPRTLPDDRVLEYPEGIVDSTKVSGMEDYYNAEVNGTTLQQTKYFNEAVTEWLYMRYLNKYYNEIKGEAPPERPAYVSKFCNDFYWKYQTFLENYVSIFESSLEYIEALFELKEELKANGQKDFTLLITQNDLYLSSFFQKNAGNAGSENFNYIELYEGTQNIIKHSPTYYIENKIKNKDCIIIPGVDELNHMILARDLVKKTGKGVKFNYLNPITNDKTFTFLDYVGDYDTISIEENLEVRSNFINEYANQKDTIDTYLTFFKGNNENSMTEEEAKTAAQNIFKNKNKKILVSAYYFDKNLTKALAENGNMFDLTYCSTWNTIGNATGIALASAVVGETLKEEAINIEISSFWENRILNYMEYNIISILEGQIYNMNRKPDLTKNSALSTYEEEKADKTGKLLAERISYTGGQGNVDGEIYLIDTLLYGKNTDKQKYEYKIGECIFQIDSVDLVATRPWNRHFEPEITTNLVLSEIEIMHTYEEEVIAPTCLRKGYTTHKCTRCENTYTDTYTDELGHSFTNYISNNDATCTKDGSKTAKCDRCEETNMQTDVGSMLSHIEVIDERIESTCTQTGLTQGKHCSECKRVLKAQEIIPKLGHDYKGIVTAPTCLRKGYTTHKCTRCGHTYMDSETEVLGHSFINYISNNDATCTKDGSKTAKCDRCEETNMQTDIGSMLEHNYSNGKCTMCGKKEPKLEIASDEYDIGELYISEIEPQTTIKEFKEKLQTNSTEIKIYNKENVLQKESVKIATGMQIELKFANQMKRFTVVVAGDVNGDGKADFKDMVTMNKHRLKKTVLEGEYLMAGDIIEDNKLDFKDIVKINKFRLHKITEL